MFTTTTPTKRTVTLSSDAFVNRIASSLGDWNLKPGASVTVNVYEVDYGDGHGPIAGSATVYRGSRKLGELSSSDAAAF